MLTIVFRVGTSSRSRACAEVQRPAPILRPADRRQDSRTEGPVQLGLGLGPNPDDGRSWRPVYLEQYLVRVDDIWAQSEVSSDLTTCTGYLFARVEGARSAEDTVVLSLSSFDGNLVFQTRRALTYGGLVKTSFEIRNPNLWYPSGYGAQHRYRLTATVIRGSERELDSHSKLIGLRRCELVQEKDKFGKSFYFRVNNIDIFATGSCWIPADSFPSRVSEQRYRDWIRLTVEGNQVMIRVWGGGIYEQDAFFNACDEFGVLVWHDFAFACGNYPTYPDFLESVELEARQNLRRLRWHPSLVGWAGNNEDYQVLERYKLEYDGDDKDPESWLKSTFPARYLYEYLLPKLIQEEDPSAIYHPGSHRRRRQAHHRSHRGRHTPMEQ